jgi:predicted ATP-dependent protease
MDRHGMLESKITEMFDEKCFLIDTKGERIGQINGLAVYNADFIHSADLQELPQLYHLDRKYYKC